MVRSFSLGPVWVVLAWTGLTWGQESSPSGAPTPPPREHTLTLREQGQPGQKCRLLKTWFEADGTKAYQVQALDTGEMITMVEAGPPSVASTQAGHPVKSVATRIYHWGNSPTPPAGVPQAPPYATILGAPLEIAAGGASPSVTQARLTLQPALAQGVNASPYAPGPVPVWKPGKQVSSAAEKQDWPKAFASQPADYAPRTEAANAQPVKYAAPAEAETTVVVNPTLKVPAKQEVKPPPAPPRKPAAPPALPTAQPLREEPKKMEGKPAAQRTPLAAAASEAKSLAADPLPTLPPPAAMPAAPPVSPAPVTPPGPQAEKQPINPVPVAVSPPTPLQPVAPTDVPAIPPTPPVPQPLASPPPGVPPVQERAPEVKAIPPTAPAQPPAVVASTPPALATPAPASKEPEMKAAVPPPPPPALATPAPASKEPEVKPAIPVPTAPPTVKEPTAQAAPSRPAPLVVECPKCPAPTRMSRPGDVAPAPVRETAAVIKAAPDSAPPSDWRQSWGKVEPAPATEPVVKNLPHAVTGKPDPLVNPEAYSRMPKGTESPEAPAGAPAPALAASAPKDVEAPAPAESSRPQQAGFTKTEPAAVRPADLPPPVSTTVSVPLPPPVTTTVSVPPAGYVPHGEPVSVPAEEGNAFSPPAGRRANPGMTVVPPNAFSGPSAAATPAPVPVPLPPNGNGYPIAVTSPIPGPMPAARDPSATTSPGPSPVREVQPASFSPAPAGEEALARHAAVLRHELLPSQREMAAEGLGQCDWQTHRWVVDTLSRAARNDPAPTVRAACIRVLAGLKAHTEEVRATLVHLKADADQRVRVEAAQALAGMEARP